MIAISEKEDGSKPTFRDSAPAGYGLVAVGAIAAGAGVYLWLRGGKSDSAPAVAVTPHGGFFGWAGSF
jgi:hypothetical protein